MRARVPLAFIAWSSVAGRSGDIAAALGGEARCFYDVRLVKRSLVPLRYLWSAWHTVAYLVLRRPRAVIVTNPPIFPALIVCAYAALARVPVLLDSHPSSFGLKGGRVWGFLLPLHAWLARRARSTLVTGEQLAERVRAWGARADIVHEPPIRWRVAPATSLRQPSRVLWVGIFAGDEPVDEVIDAARLVPDVEVQITGDLRRCPSGLRERAPQNVRFVGFLRGPEFQRAVEEADAVLTLTTLSSSVMRAGYEAIYAERPLIVTDWPNLREVFPHAVHVRNDAEAIADGIRHAIEHHAKLLARAPEALGLQEERWSAQLTTLRARLGGDDGTPV